jgi:multimeric flavodoxin WrbA
VASPVYGLGFPAPLKAVFDRTQQYFEAKFSLGIQRPIEKPKRALFLTAFGSENHRGVELMREQLALVFLLLNTSLEQTIMAPHTDKVPVDLKTVKAEIKQELLRMKM